MLGRPTEDAFEIVFKSGAKFKIGGKTVEVDPAFCKECGYCREMYRMDIFAVSDGFNAGGCKPSVVKSPTAALAA